MLPLFLGISILHQWFYFSKPIVIPLNLRVRVCVRACVRDFSRGIWMFDACGLGCPELYFFLLPHVFLFSSLRPHPILIPHLSSSA